MVGSIRWFTRHVGNNHGDVTCQTQDQFDRIGTRPKDVVQMWNIQTDLTNEFERQDEYGGGEQRGIEATRPGLNTCHMDE